ncbi:SDR family oxidoreductase [Pseudomonas sp. R4-83]|uniref:SDR family oxidoreductase n=1 Tax=unclassified Pseudomonas TaxID=196821 RepID=UPI003DAA49B8
MKQVIVITGASSGFGALTARALAQAGHTVYASMRETLGRNAPQVQDAARYAEEHRVDLRTVEMDVASSDSVEAGIAQVIKEAGRLDVVIHNAGHMSFGPAEAFTPEQFAQLYDINVLSTQRVNRAALPYMRQQVSGLVLWVSSSSARGGTPPYLAPYFAAKAAMDSLAVSYASELTRWGIDTTIVVPGAFTKGTNHFVHSGTPADSERAAEYHTGPYAGVPEQSLKGLAALEPEDADVADVARAIVEIVDIPVGRRPFRRHVDPSQDGAEIVNAMADRVRAEMLRRIGLEDLLHTRVDEVGVQMAMSQERK